MHKIRDDDPSAESTDNCTRGLNWALELEAEKKVGEPVSYNVAKLVGQRFNKKLSDDKYKQKAACYQKPSNCESLVIPKVNSEIWMSMSSGTRAVDAKHQEFQGALIHGDQPLIKLTNMMARHFAEKQPLKVADLQARLQMAIDSFGFIGHESALLNMKRREAIKPEINNEFNKFVVHRCLLQIVCSATIYLPE